MTRTPPEGNTRKTWTTSSPTLRATIVKRRSPLVSLLGRCRSRGRRVALRSSQASTLQEALCRCVTRRASLSRVVDHLHVTCRWLRQAYNSNSLRRACTVMRTASCMPIISPVRRRSTESSGRLTKSTYVPQGFMSRTHPITQCRQEEQILAQTSQRRRGRCHVYQRAQPRLQQEGKHRFLPALAALGSHLSVPIQIARYYDKYTAEIRASFERGTAL